MNIITNDYQFESISTEEYLANKPTRKDLTELNIKDLSREELFGLGAIAYQDLRADEKIKYFGMANANGKAKEFGPLIFGKKLWKELTRDPAKEFRKEFGIEGGVQ